MMMSSTTARPPLVEGVRVPYSTQGTVSANVPWYIAATRPILAQIEQERRELEGKS